jgi:hypothetical protein
MSAPLLVEPEFEDVGIVLIGDFNPAIFNPDWLLQNDLVGADAAKRSVIDIIHPDVAQFRVGDIELIVQRNRFQILTRVAPFVAVLDFVSKTFGESLPHTPVRQSGINHSVHFKVKNQKIRTAIGRILASTHPWGQWGEDIEKSSAEFQGGMASLSMQEVRSSSSFMRRITATVQPSTTVANQSGIYVSINDHNEPESKDKTSMSVLDALISRFDSSLLDSKRIINTVMLLKDKAHV